MDRVFDQQTPDVMPVDVAIQDCPILTPPKTPDTAAATTAAQAKPWLVPALSGLAVAGVLSSLWLANHWTIARSQLNLERDLLLIERLRDRGTKADDTAPKATSSSAISAQDEPGALAPPPPETESEWGTALEPLTVPVQPVLQGSPAPPAIDEVLPLSTGMVQGPGGTSSAIFQVNNASISSGIGDAIGNSGWTLSSVSEAGAVIQRNGISRTLSVGGLF